MIIQRDALRNCIQLTYCCVRFNVGISRNFDLLVGMFVSLISRICLCVDSAVCQEDTKHFITSVVIGKDCVPRYC